MYFKAKTQIFEKEKIHWERENQEWKQKYKMKNNEVWYGQQKTQANINHSKQVFWLLKRLKM